MAVKTLVELEAWTLPGVGAFAAVVTGIPFVDFKGTDPASGLGGGSFSVPNDFVDLDLICNRDTKTETLIRVRINGTLVDEYAFYARNRNQDFDDAGHTQISGPGAADLLSAAITYPYDYQKVDAAGNEYSNWPDWIYGSNQNGLADGDFENPPLYITNGGLELGIQPPWSPGPLTGISVVSGGAHAGTYYLEIVPGVLDAGAGLTVPVVPNARYIIQAYVTGSGDVEMGCSVPGDIIRTILNSSGEVVGQEIIGSTAKPEVPGGTTGELNIQYDSGISDPDDPDYRGVAYVEIREIVAAGGGWTPIVIQMFTGNGQTSMDINFRNRNSIHTFGVDSLTVDGLGIGLDAWRPVGSGNKLFPGAQPINAQLDDVPDTGLYCAVVSFNAPGQGVAQSISGIQPGGTYTITARVKTSVAGTKIRMILETALGYWLPRFADGTGDAAEFITGSGAWEDVSMTVTLPEFIPGDGVTVPANELVVLKFVGGEVVPGASKTFRVDNVQFAPGLPAATIGDILTQLHADAAVDHIADGRTTVAGAGHLAFLTLGFTAVVDSNGNAWATPANPSGLESVTVKRGMSYLQFMEQTVTRLGYEWKVTWNGTAWQLDVYNPAGLGTDVSGTVSLVTGKVGPSQIGLNAPGSNVIVAEGNKRIFSQLSEAADLAAYGRREGYFPQTRADGHDTLDEWASANALVQFGQGEGHRIELNDGSDFYPYIDFSPGDTVNVALPGFLSSRNLPVKQVVMRVNDRKASFHLDVNSDPPDRSAVPFLVLDKMLSRFDGINDDFKFGGGTSRPIQTGGIGASPESEGGGVVEIFIAASNASEKSKAMADYQCDGVLPFGDQFTIETARSEHMGTAGSRPVKFVFSEGDFEIDGPVEFYHDWDWIPITIEGQGRGVTRFNIRSTSLLNTPFYVDGPNVNVRGFDILLYRNGASTGYTTTFAAWAPGRYENIGIWVDPTLTDSQAPTYGFDFIGSWDELSAFEFNYPSSRTIAHGLHYEAVNDTHFGLGILVEGHSSLITQCTAVVGELGTGIYLNADTCVVSACHVQGGLYSFFSDEDNCVFSGNIAEPHETAFKIQNGYSNLIIGNVITGWYLSATNTTDAIEVIWSAVPNGRWTYITGNVIRRRLGGSTAQFRRAVNVNDAQAVTAAIGNDWRGGHGTSPPHVNVSVETWPAGGAGTGDNLV